MSGMRADSTYRGFTIYLRQADRFYAVIRDAKGRAINRSQASSSLIEGAEVALEHARRDIDGMLLDLSREPDWPIFG